MSSNKLMYGTYNTEEKISQGNLPLSYLLDPSFKINSINKNKGNKQNCIPKYYENNKFNLYNSTRLTNDKDGIDYYNKQSQFPGKYITNNYHSCSCKATEISNTAFSQPNIFFRDGYGWTSNEGCNIDSDSLLRNGSLITNPGPNKRQLFTRPYLSVPFKGKGLGNSDKECKLIKGKFILNKDNSDKISEKTLGNFIPLVSKIKKNIQKPSNIITEDNRKDWIRGGVPSRQIIKNMNYRSTSRKETN
jgi:hypothetical protein